jgi:two-component system CheB/CheR fusion protein
MKPAAKPEPSKIAPESPLFPIVGIGASAGGLEALGQFLAHVPDNSGMAYVIVQHLDPDHTGMLTELLQRSTGMKVVQVTDRVKVKPDCVYVIPPGKDMSLLHGRLHLFEPSEARGMRLPIDIFFRSLADDRAERSIGVILSGMGSDGTLGLRAIKEKGGVALVQEPASAKFDSMPKCAIRAGLADLVAPVEDLPGMILTRLSHAPLIAGSAPLLEETEQSSLEKIVILLREKSGHDFSLYKKGTIYRRIERRMVLHQIAGIADYVRYLQRNPHELELLFNDLLIGVTNFFRDPATWELLKTEGIAALLAARPGGGVIRAWSVGCSTGEEAYSLAILFTEALEQLNPAGNFTLLLFATDLDPEGIETARHGYYPANIAADVSVERLKRFFTKDDQGYRVCNEIRKMVTFARQNIITDPPFTTLDILICRNLLIYFAPELKNRLLPLFSYSLNPGGILFLGKTEAAAVNSDLFVPLGDKPGLFRRSEVAHARDVMFPLAFVTSRPGAPKELTMCKPTANIQSLVDSVVLQHFSPPTVLTNDQGEILYFSGRTGKYLEPPTGKPNVNILAMAREGLRYELGIALHKAVRSNSPIVARNLTLGTNGGTQTIDLTVRMLEEPPELRGMIMIVFSDVSTPQRKKASGRAKSSAADSDALHELEKETQRTREELHTTQEEMQTSQEEMRAAYEELQSVNEELQSTNEELTTSKEEMQSMNEELYTINAEQMTKVDELFQLNSDMKNLLDSTEIITLFLDKCFRVRRFTSGANKLFKLIPGDVGRPLSDLVTSLNYPDLALDVEEVLRTLVFTEKRIQAGEGNWFRVRIMPYRTLDDIIDGVVITFMDVSIAMARENDLLMKIEELERRVGGISVNAASILRTV